MFKKNRLLIITVAASVLFILLGNRIASSGGRLFGGGDERTMITAKVTELGQTVDNSYSVDGTESISGTILYFKAESSDGTSIECVQYLDAMYALSPAPVEKGDKVQLLEPEQGTDGRWIMSAKVRSDFVLGMALIFCALVIIFGKKKGALTIVSLLFTCLSIFLVFVPAVLTGRNIYLWAIIICVYVTVMTLLVVYGIDAKSISAAIGCVGGTLLAGLLMLAVTELAGLTGLVEEESVYLMLLNPDNPINLKAVIFACTVIGALGAIMDVSISISSSLFELKRKLHTISARELTASGLTIGRDMLGTMANTLVLAYIGSCLTCVLLLFSYTSSVGELINREQIIVEILQALIGSIGILLTIPLTSFVCGKLYCDN